MEVVKGDKTSEVFKELKPWLKSIDSIYAQCLDDFDYRPFHDYELAAVSLMVGAAHRAGLLAFAECGVEKEGRSGSGRGDLWIACPEKHYWFEFKRSAFNPKAKKWGLKHALESAVNDIRDLSLAKGEVGIAGVIAATNNMKSGFREEYRSFVNNVDYAFHFGPDGSRGAYLFLKLVVK